jgi:uncharacterized protein YraI
MRLFSALPFYLLTVSVISYVLPCSEAVSESPELLAAKAKTSIVYISFEVTDAVTGARSQSQGTGFVVSKDGYVLTASHLFREWRRQVDVEKDKNKIYGTLHDKPGFSGGSPFILQTVKLGDPDAEDVALLKLPYSANNDYPVAQICFKEASTVVTNAEIFAFGFPEDHNFQPVPGRLGTQNAAAGRWYASSAFTHGMSGGPVYTTQGFVMGIVKGGSISSEDVRWITPIFHAKSFLPALFEEQCGGVCKYRVVNVSSIDVLNMRIQPDPNANIKVGIPPDGRGLIKSDCVTASGGTWCTVQYQGHSGWVNERYIEPEADRLCGGACLGTGVKHKIVAVTSTDQLYIRPAPGDLASATGSIPSNGVNVEVHQCQGNWCFICYRGLRGWVNKLYLARM